MLLLLDGIIMHTEEFILIPKRMFITKQPQKSEIIENPQCKNKAIQLSLMQRNKLINDENVEQTDRVIQTDPTNIERDVDKADRVVQTNPTKFEDEKWRLLVMTVKLIQLLQKNQQLNHLSR